MVKCSSCFSDTLKDLGEIKACSNCGYTIYTKEFLEQEDSNTTFKMFLLKLFNIPIIALFFIMIAIVFLSVTEIYTFFANPTNPISIINTTSNINTTFNVSEMSLNLAGKLLVYFFIMLALVDFGYLISEVYVLHALFPSKVEPTLEQKHLQSTVYLEKLMAFGMIIIILDVFSKIFLSNNTQDFTAILIGVSIVIISIGLWKYLSLKAESNYLGKR